MPPEFAEALRWVAFWFAPTALLAYLVKPPRLQRWVGLMALYFPLMGQHGFVVDFFSTIVLFAFVEWLYLRTRLLTDPESRPQQ